MFCSECGKQVSEYQKFCEHCGTQLVFLSDQSSSHESPNQPENSLRQGFGKEVFDDGSVYEGDWKDGEMHGDGILRHSDGLILQGIFVKGDIVRGQWIESDFVFEGTFNAGSKMASGIGKWTSGLFAEFNGEWEGAVPYHGTLYLRDGIQLSNTGDIIIVYEGPFKNGIPRGIGKAQKTNGEVISVRSYSTLFTKNFKMEEILPGMDPYL